MAENTKKSTNDGKHQVQDSKDRKVILLMGMGINGIAANGWIPPFENETEFEEMEEDLWTILESVDTFIFGRVTFQGWEKHWPSHANNPSSSDFQKKFSKFADQVQKIVFSTTLKSVDWQNSRVINDDISTEISRIKKLPGKNIAIVGGAEIAQTFTKLNLIDDYQILLHQAIFGPNKPLLGQLEEYRELKLINVKKYQSGGLRLHYRSLP